MLICFYMIGFQAPFLMVFIITYALAMASTAQAVIVGCSVEDIKMAQEILPMLFIPQMLFAGFFVTPDLIPIWMRWAQYLCSLTYALRLMLIEEFDRDCGSPDANENCQGVLERTEADTDEAWWYWLVLVGIFVVFRFIAMIILKGKASKFY